MLSQKIKRDNLSVPLRLNTLWKKEKGTIKTSIESNGHFQQKGEVNK